MHGHAAQRFGIVGHAWFYTANHCLEDESGDFAASKGGPAAVARTFQTYWLFQSTICGVDTAANVDFSTLTSGTTLLARGVDYDWALVRLNDASPPPGVTFAAWNGNGVLAGAPRPTASTIRRATSRNSARDRCMPITRTKTAVRSSR